MSTPKEIGLTHAISFHKHSFHELDAERHREAGEKHSACATIAKIKERLYELENQHEPLASLVAEKDQLSEEYTRQREAFMRALYYVVFGSKVKP